MHMTLEGRAFIYTYKSGLKVEGEFLGSSRLRWRAITGPAAGKTGEEAASIAELRPGLWFVSWVETSGATVSQTLDLETMTVNNFVTFDTPGGRRGMLDAGTLEETRG
jgi:phenolic acid decarboxylase